MQASTTAAAIMSNAPARYPRKSAVREPVWISSPKMKGRCHAADERSGSIEDGDGEASDFKRKDFTYGEIGGAGGCRRDEEDDGPAERLGLCGEQAMLKKPAAQGQQDAGERVGNGDHRAAANGIKQAAEHERANEVSQRERKQVEPNFLRGQARRT